MPNRENRKAAMLAALQIALLRFSSAALLKPALKTSMLKLIPVRCCICDIEDSVPTGVGEDFEYRTSSDTFLAQRCRRCGVVYLNPRPATEELSRIYPSTYHAFNFSP